MHPILFQIGGFKLHTYGVLILVAVLAALVFARARAGRFGMKPADVESLGIWVVISGVLGARIAFIAQEWDFYGKDWHRWATLEFEGLTSFGGLILGAIVAVLWARANRVSIAAVTDMVSAPMLLGWAIGRVGCLMNGCCYGPVSHAWFAVHVEDDGALHQPAQLYDSVFNLIGLAVLLSLERKGLKRAMSTGLFFILNGAARFVYEFWRAGVSSTYWGVLPITQAQAMALAFVVVGSIICVVAARRGAPVSTALDLGAHSK